jgi:hypothetical protein
MEKSEGSGWGGQVGVSMAERRDVGHGLSKVSLGFSSSFFLLLCSHVTANIKTLFPSIL